MYLGLMIKLPSVPDELQTDFVQAMKLFKKRQFASSYQALTSVRKKHRSSDQVAYNLEFDWLLQLNKYACKELSVFPVTLGLHEVPVSLGLVSDCELEPIIQQIQGLPPRINIEIELMMIHNWTLTGIKHNCDTAHIEKLLSYIRDSFLRLISLTGKPTNFSFVATYSTDALTIELIVKMVLQCKDELHFSALHLFCVLCLSASWLLMLQKKYDVALRLAQLIKENYYVNFSQRVEDIITSCHDSGNDFMTDLMNLIMAYCLISCQQAVAEAVECLRSIKSEEWRMSIDYVIAALHLNNGEAMKALSLAKSILSSDLESQPAMWRSRFLNLAGCCLASQGKPYSAVECFRKAVTDDPTYLIPLLNICFQYKVLRVPDAELKGLNLLLQEIKKRDDTDIAGRSESCNLEQPLPLVTPLRLTKADVLYLLAERHQELFCIDESAEFYKKLFHHLQDRSLLQIHVCLPLHALPWIYQEAAYTMFRSSHYEECISLCEMLMKNCPETVREIQPGMLRKLFAEPPSLNYHMPKHNPMFDPPSFSNLEQLPNVNSCAVGCKILMLKSLVLAKLGKTQLALDILKRIRMSISVIDFSNDAIEAPMKKPRIELSECSINVEEVNEWTILSSAVHCCLGVLLLELEEKKEATQMLRIAILTSPSNIEAYWHYTQLLLREGDKEKAMKTWSNIRSGLIEPYLGEKLKQVFYTITKEDVRELNESICM